MGARSAIPAFDVISSTRAGASTISRALMMLWRCRVKNAQRFLPPHLQGRTDRAKITKGVHARRKIGDEQLLMDGSSVPAPPLGGVGRSSSHRRSGRSRPDLEFRESSTSRARPTFSK